MVAPIISSSHLSLNREGRWGTTDDFATSFLHLSVLHYTLWFGELHACRIPWYFLPTSSSVCIVFFPLSLCLASRFWPDLMNGRHNHNDYDEYNDFKVMDFTLTYIVDFISNLETGFRAWRLGELDVQNNVNRHTRLVFGTRGVCSNHVRREGKKQKRPLSASDMLTHLTMCCTCDPAIRHSRKSFLSSSYERFKTNFFLSGFYFDLFYTFHEGRSERAI